MMKRLLAATAAIAISTTFAQAQEVKVGVNLPYTGIGAELAQWIDRGMEMYLPLWLRLWGAQETPMFNVRVVRQA